MSNTWITSIKEVMEIFRGALIAIIPWIEKARINWKDGDSYDDWDNITQTLFKNIVCSSIEGEVLSEYTLAIYGFENKDYSNLDYIRVKNENHSDKELVFISFQSEYTPMDKVKVGILDSNKKIIGFSNIDIADLEFSLIKKGERRIEIEEIRVEL